LIAVEKVIKADPAVEVVMDALDTSGRAAMMAATRFVFVTLKPLAERN